MNKVITCNSTLPFSIGLDLLRRAGHICRFVRKIAEQKFFVSREAKHTKNLVRRNIRAGLSNIFSAMEGSGKKE